MPMRGLRWTRKDAGARPDVGFFRKYKVSVVLLLCIAAAVAAEVVAIYRHSAAVRLLTSLTLKPGHGPYLRRNPEEIKAATRSEIERALWKSPDEPPPTGLFSSSESTYTWQGVRSYSVKVYYTSLGGPEVMRKFEVPRAEQTHALHVLLR